MSTLFTALVGIVLVAFIMATVNVNQMVTDRIKMQNAADASAMTAAVWEARGLNMIAAINDAMLVGYGLIVGIAIICLLSPPGVGVGLYQVAKKIFNIIKKLAKLERKIAKAIPVVATLSAIKIAEANGLTAAIALDGKTTTLSLYVKEPSPKDLGRLFGKTGEWMEWLISWMGISGSGISFLPLIRDKSHKRNEEIVVIGYKKARALKIGREVLKNGKKNATLPRIDIISQGTVYGSQSLLFPDWDARLERITAHDHILGKSPGGVGGGLITRGLGSVFGETILH